MAAESLYYVVDVFTSSCFEGNPLAVFPQAEGIPEELLPRIAAELNLSETAFVYPPSGGGTRRVRIFTPGAELPFAGHPTIGTAWLLANLGEIKLVDGAATAILEEGVGPIPIALSEDAEGEIRVRCTAAQLPNLEGSPPSPQLLARALGIAVDSLDLRFGGCWSAGVSFLVVGVRDLAALGSIRVDAIALEEALGHGAGGVYVVVVGDNGRSVRCRMFAPDLGVAEDPGTGSAALAFAGSLGAAGLVEADGTTRIEIEQGVEMGRPCRLGLEVEATAGRITAVHLLGTAVLVSSASMRLSRPKLPRPG